MNKTNKTSVESCPAYATFSIQDALKKRSSIEEADTIWISPYTKEKSRGMFKCNTISGSTFLDMLNRNTMLRECHTEFLMTGKVTGKTVSQDVAMLDCYKQQADNGDFSERISSDTVAQLAQHPKDLSEAVYNWIPRSEYEQSYVSALRKLWESFLEDNVHRPHIEVYEDEVKAAWDRVAGARDELYDMEHESSWFGITVEDGILG